MKNVASFGLIFFALFTGVVSGEKQIREDLVVINIEVPVRVVRDGKTVGDLKKSDFRLFEDGKEIQINGFTEVRKKISAQKIGLEAEREQ